MSIRTCAPLLVVASGKGGVGKTTVAANVAAELATQSLRVLLVDFDLGLANVDVLLALDARRTLEDALAGRCELRECVVTTSNGLNVLPAACGAPDLAQLDTQRIELLLDAVRELSAGYDVVIADAAAGIGLDVLTLAARADRVWVVTTPDPAALSDAYGLIKALDVRAREQTRDVATPELVLNCVSGVDEARRLAAKLGAVCERFLARAPRLAGWLPRSPRIQEACRRQRTFAGAPARGLEAHCLGELARRVARMNAPRAVGAGAAQA